MKYTGISIQDQEIKFQKSKNSIRIMLAQISPAYDQDLLTEEGLVKVKNPERQAQKIIKIIDHAISTEIDILLFPELTAPFGQLNSFENNLHETDKDIVVNICYEHTILKDLLPLLSEQEIEQLEFNPIEQATKVVNFCRILTKVGPKIKIFTQFKLTPYSSEFSLATKNTLFCGKTINRFITNFGNFLFLICKDYVGEIGDKKKLPMFDFLKSLTAEGLHYIFVSSLNPEPEAFNHAARAFYYLQEKSAHTFTIILNTAELDKTTIIFPLRPHPKIRKTHEIELTPLFNGKPEWGTQLHFPGHKERLISGTFQRLDKYEPMPTKEIFSPVYQTDIIDIAELGIESELMISPEQVSIKEKATEVPISHNLPVQSTPFLGREDEVAELIKLLENPTCRLITLVGPGGIGKTRLSIHIASQKIDAFPDGVYFIPLASAISVDFLNSTIADALNITFYGSKEPKAQLLNHLSEKKMLLLMDNFEHLLVGAKILAEIIEVSQQTKVLVTSRERLNLKGEWLFEVKGMGFPKNDNVDQLENYSAVQLFLQTAQRTNSNFVLSDEEKPYLIRICQLIKGMPLGIELAASWVRLLSCREIVKEIERNIDFLATSFRDIPERHRSLRAVFEHSWNLLSEPERNVFKKISIFRGGFNREGAHKVSGASLPILSTLVDKSLLYRKPSERYEIHELLRQYAEEKLNEFTHEKEEVQNLHCQYYAEFLKQREEILRGSKQQETLEEINEEIENIRFSWNWAVEKKMIAELEKFIYSLNRFYDRRSWFQEGFDMLNKAYKNLAEFALSDELDKNKTLVLGKIIEGQGVFSYRLGHYEKAEKFLEKSLGFYRQQDAQKELASCLSNLSFLAYLQGKPVKAKQLGQESLTIRQTINYKYGIAHSLINLSYVVYDLGEYVEAKELCEKGLTISQETGDQWGIAVALNNLGNIYLALGDYKAAHHYFQDTLKIVKAMSDRRLIALSLNRLGMVASLQGKYKEAKKLLNESIIISQEISNQHGIAHSISDLGYVNYKLKQYSQAKQLYQQCLTIFKEINDQWGIANSFNSLGNITSALEENQESQNYFHQALKTAMTIHALPIVLDILVGFAKLIIKQGEKEKALEFLTISLTHSAAEQETKKRAHQLISELESQLNTKVVDTIKQKSKLCKLEEVAAAILMEY